MAKAVAGPQVAICETLGHDDGNAMCPQRSAKILAVLHVRCAYGRWYGPPSLTMVAFVYGQCGCNHHTSSQTELLIPESSLRQQSDAPKGA